MSKENLKVKWKGSGAVHDSRIRLMLLSQQGTFCYILLGEDLKRFVMERHNQKEDMRMMASEC